MKTMASRNGTQSSFLSQLEKEVLLVLLPGDEYIVFYFPHITKFLWKPYFCYMIHTYIHTYVTLKLFTGSFTYYFKPKKQL